MIGYFAIAAIAIGVGLLVFLVFASIPSKADIVAVVAPPTEVERQRVERKSFSQSLASVMPKGYTGWVQRKIIYAGRVGQWTVGGFLILRLVSALIAIPIVIGSLPWRRAPAEDHRRAVRLPHSDRAGGDAEQSRRGPPESDSARAPRHARPDDHRRRGWPRIRSIDGEGGTEGSAPLAEELIRTLQDMSIGRSRSDAYRPFSSEPPGPPAGVPYAP